MQVLRIRTHRVQSTRQHKCINLPRARACPSLNRARLCDLSAAPTQMGVQGQIRSSFASDVGVGTSQQQPQNSVKVEECIWQWRWRSAIRYYKAGTQSPPLLLIHGFGVGAWHYERNMEALAQSHTVYAIDLLGQGSSWPANEFLEELKARAAAAASSTTTASATAAAAAGISTGAAAQVGPTGSTASVDMEEGGEGPLCYSIDMWTRQMAEFLRDVVGAPAYVGGNSLGGYVAVSLASSHPDLVRGLVLLNSTPFWSFKPPASQPQGIWGMAPALNATVPVSQGLRRAIEVMWWDRLRSDVTVRSMLSLVYAHKPSVQDDPELVRRIIDATEQPGALDAFASIVLAPRSELDFDTMLRRLACPVALVYGKQDPWVVPMWGQRAAHVLRRSGAAPVMYLELDGAGHCPHHEAPNATNKAVQLCLTHMEELRAWHETGCGSGSADAPQPPLAVGQRVEVAEQPDGRVVVIEHVEGKARILPEIVTHATWNTLEAFQAVLGGVGAAGGGAVDSVRA